MKSKRSSSQGLKTKGKSQKKQGSEVESGSLSDDRQERMPTHRERGMGSEFANSVKAVMDESKDLKGSANSFLGVDKQIIDPKQFAHSLVDRKSK